MNHLNAHLIIFKDAFDSVKNFIATAIKDIPLKKGDPELQKRFTTFISDEAALDSFAFGIAKYLTERTISPEKEECKHFEVLFKSREVKQKSQLAINDFADNIFFKENDIQIEAVTFSEIISTIKIKKRMNLH